MGDSLSASDDTFQYILSGSKYDFSRKGHNHRVSERLLLAKDGVPYPESWVSCTASYLKSFLRPHISWWRSIVVCSIPSGGTTGIGSDRLKQFLDRLASFIGNDEIVFDSDVLSFRDGIRSNKSLNQHDRFENVKDHLLVAKPDNLAGAFVVVLDDIVTSGATFFYANRYSERSWCCSCTLLSTGSFDFLITVKTDIKKKLFALNKLKGIGPATLRKLMSTPGFDSASVAELAEQNTKLKKSFEAPGAWEKAIQLAERRP